jgi:hypothetical protein
MNHKPNAQPVALLTWMDGLADETRLRLLHLLEQNELGVSSCARSCSFRNRR